MAGWLYDPGIPFHMWDLTHIFTIGIIIFVLVTVYMLRQQLTPYRRIIRITIGILLIFSRLSLDFWYVKTGEWTLSSSLPLELCSIASLISGIMLLTKSRFLFEVLYFIAIGGAMQAILTPALDFGFPQYRYIQFFADHTMLMLAPLILMWFYHFKLTWKSVGKAFVTINVIAGIVFLTNQLIGANYMFLTKKPSTASLLDVLGPYPYYLLSLEAIVLIIFVVLYLPFVLKN